MFNLFERISIYMLIILFIIGFWLTIFKIFGAGNDILILASVIISFITGFILIPILKD